MKTIKYRCTFHLDTLTIDFSQGRVLMQATLTPGDVATSERGQKVTVSFPMMDWRGNEWDSIRKMLEERLGKELEEGKA